MQFVFSTVNIVSFYFITVVGAKEKSWTLGNAQRLKGGKPGRDKQMPLRPRSVNSTFEKRPKPIGYPAVNEINNRSFQDNGGSFMRFVSMANGQNALIF